MTDNTQSTPLTNGTATTAAPPPIPPRPPLRRSSSDRVLAGVAGGVGRWLGIDPVIVRVVLVVLAIFGGSGLLLYLVGWLFIPEEGTASSEADRFIARGSRPGSTTRTVLVVIAAIVGTIIVINLLSAGPFHAVWGLGGGGSILLLIAVGVLVIWLVNRDQPGRAPSEPSTVVPPAPGQPLASTIEPAGSVDPGMATLVEAPAPAAPTGYAYGGSGNYPGYAAPPTTPVPPRPPKPRSYLGLATLSLSLLVMGLLGALSLSGAVSIPAVVVLAGGLAVLGLGLLVGSVIGRARWLMSIAIPMLMVTALVALIPANLRLPKDASIGERSWVPTNVVEASANHSLAVGDAVLDLTRLSVPAGTTAAIPIQAEVGIGELLVKAPAGMTVHIVASANNGEIRIDGLPTRSGRNLKVVADLPGIVSPASPVIDLNVQVGLGSLEVSRA